MSGTPDPAGMVLAGLRDRLRKVESCLEFPKITNDCE